MLCINVSELLRLLLWTPHFKNNERFSTILICVCVFVCLGMWTERYLQYPMLHTSTNRKIPHLKDMPGERTNVSISKLYFIKRYLDLIMYILDKINHNVERQEMPSKLSEQLLSGREYKTVMVFRQSNVKHDVHVYTILANRANYKHYLTAGKSHAQKLTEK